MFPSCEGSRTERKRQGRGCMYMIAHVPRQQGEISKFATGSPLSYGIEEKTLVRCLLCSNFQGNRRVVSLK